MATTGTSLTDRPQLLTDSDVARMLGVHRRSVHRMASAGELPAPVRIGRRCTRWRMNDLRRFLDSRRSRPEPDPSELDEPTIGCIEKLAEALRDGDRSRAEAARMELRRQGVELHFGTEVGGDE